MTDVRAAVRDLVVRAVGDPSATGTVVAAVEQHVADLPGPEQDAVLVDAFRAVRPNTEAWLRGHGATPEQAADSTADVDRKLDRYGLRGTGLDWFCAVLTARVVAVGRLQFELGDTQPDGRPAWGVHVPETGPLDPEACDRSFASAPTVLRALAPEHAADHWQCRSWILDPGLPDVLGPDANLVRFARRFRLSPPGPDDEREGDADVTKFVLGPSAGGRLAEAVRARLDSGGHWTVRSGTAPVR